MKNLTKNLLLTGATFLIGHQAMAGGNHFHATCAFDTCNAVKDKAEILARLPQAADMLGLDEEWKKATVEGDLKDYKDDVVQFTAVHPNKKDKKLFSFKKNGILLGAKTVK